MVDCVRVSLPYKEVGIMALYEVVLQSSYVGQEIINRWNYVSSGTPASVLGSFALISAMGAIPSAGVYPSNTLLKKIAALSVPAMQFEVLTVLNVYDDTDFYSTPFVPDFAGSSTGEGAPPFVAVGFRSNRVTRAIRRATKRFVGVSETNIGSGGVLVNDYLTPVNAVADAMTQPLSYDDEGNILNFVPAVCSKQKYLSNPDPERFAYRYYPTLAEQLTHTAQGITWEGYTEVRSQASRQYGKGR